MIEIRPSRIHGRGAFAIRDIAAGTKVAEYIGERITKEESIRRCEAGNPFLFYLDEETDLDGSITSNPGKWFNHSCDPNCEALLAEGRIWLTARRSIALGEELTFNYGYSLEFYRQYPCCCGADACVGYMVSDEFHGQIRRMRAGSSMT